MRAVDPCGTFRGLEWCWSGDEGGLTDSIFLGEDIEGVLGDLPNPTGAARRVDGAPNVLKGLPIPAAPVCPAVEVLRCNLRPCGVGRAAVSCPVPALDPCLCRRACWKAKVAPFCTGKAVGCAAPPSSSLNGFGVGRAPAKSSSVVNDADEARPPSLE